MPLRSVQRHGFPAGFAPVVWPCSVLVGRERRARRREGGGREHRDVVGNQGQDGDRIVEVNDLPVDYTEPPSDRIEKIIIGSKGDEYKVVKEHGKTTCTCPGFTFRGRCRHLAELELTN